MSKFGVGLYFFAIAEVGLCLLDRDEVFLLLDGLDLSIGQALALAHHEALSKHSY